MAPPHSWALPCLCLPQLCLGLLHNGPAFLTVPRGGDELRPHPSSQTPRHRVRRSEGVYCRVCEQTDRRRMRGPGSGELERAATLKSSLGTVGGRCGHGGQEGECGHLRTMPGPCRKATCSQPEGDRKRDISREGQDTGWTMTVGAETSFHHREGWSALPHGQAVSITQV